MFQRFFLIIIFYCLQLGSVSAGLFISEILPNTTDDKNLEYIELINYGDTQVDISGYYLQDKSKKKYTFLDETYIDSGEKIKYLRPETKLILNNTNEEIYLYDSSGDLLDTLLYSSSSKGDVILGENIPENEAVADKNEQVPEVVDDDFDNLLLWLTGEESFPEEETEDSKITETSKEEIILPTISWSFQQPTYFLDEEEFLEIYQCDLERDECKMNLDLRNSFSGSVRESDYRCEVDFGFETGQENKCNPNTIVFGTGSFDIQIRIFDKETESMASSGSFIVENIPQAETSNTLAQQESTSSSQSVNSSEEIRLPAEIIVGLQRPSYVEILPNAYICDTSRQGCKVNFDFRDSFSEEFPERDYICLIDFGFETEQESKCNPNTVTFPVGEHDVIFKILSEDNPEIFIEKKIFLKNEGYIPKPSGGTSSSLSSQSNETQKKYLSPATIEIQSGLEYRNGGYFCTKKECKINLKYEKTSDYESCVWAFGKGATYNNGTQKRCNPGYVNYPEGEFKVHLQVYQKGLSTNSRKSYIEFQSLEEEGIIEASSLPLGETEGGIIEEESIKSEPEEAEEQEQEQETENIIEEIIYNYRDLQIGDAFPNPKGNDNKEWLDIYNRGNEKINLLGCQIDDKKEGGSRPYKIKEDLFIEPESSYRFYKIFTGLNLNNAGDDVHLTCDDTLIDSISRNFKVEDNTSISHEYPGGRLLYQLDILSELSSEDYIVFANKTFKQSERLLKSGLKISGETLPNSQIKITLGNNMQDIELTSDIDGLYEVLLTDGLLPGDIQVQTEVIDATGSLFFFESKKSLEITSQYISSLVKIKKAKRKTTKKTSVKKPTTYLISTANASDISEEQSQTSQNFIILFLVIIFGFLLSFLMLKKRGILDEAEYLLHCLAFNKKIIKIL